MWTNTVIDGVYYSNYGEPIKPGENIKLNFAGGPSDMPGQWVLVAAKLRFTTVSYSDEVELTVRAGNGNERTYFPVFRYSPYGDNGEEAFRKYLMDGLAGAITELE